jgi:hypothetical protein
MPSPDPYEHVVMQQATRELADRLFAVLRAEDADLALDAIGMTILRVLLSADPDPGVTRQEVIEQWIDQLRRCIARLG